MSVTLSGFTLSKPSSAPTAAAGTVSGSLDTSAVYQYKVTYVTGFGESLPNASAASVTTTSTGSVELTAIPVSADTNVIQRKIYRTVGGGTSFLLLATIDDNSTTTYTDTIADGSLGAAVPTVATASSLQNVAGDIKISRPLIHSVETAITANTAGTSTAAYQLTAAYNEVATASVLNSSIKLPGLHSGNIGTYVKIRNNGAQTIKIYPFDGQTINGGSADAAVTLATVTSADFVSDSASNWRQMS